MKIKYHLLTAILGTSALIGCASIHSNTIEQVLTADTRSEQNMARDQYRHPAETLAFFEIEPDQTVVEIWPGGGWYTEILAPYLKENGTYYAAHFPADIDNNYFKNSLAKFKQKMAFNSAYNKVQLTEFNPKTHQDIAPEGSADLVLTFRNLHNWYIYNGETGAVAAYKAFYKALKPGGILGVVDHKMPENFDLNANKKSGYVKMSQAISWAQQAGFELEASSDINANAKDTADHPKGVWTLPPSLRLGEENKANYLAIGESDRFTLKFRKPK